MGRRVREAWPVVAGTAIAIAVTTLGLYVVFRSRNRADLSSFWALAVAAAVAVASLISWLWRGWLRSRSTDSVGGDLGKFADRLADAVEEEWTTAAAQFGLIGVEPISVTWQRPSAALAGPVAAAVGSTRFRPLPGINAADQHLLQRGIISELHAVYGGLRSGRLIIAGPPGFGKSGAAVLLALAALRYRKDAPIKDRSLIPVPVIFTLHGWNPRSESVYDWLGKLISRTYPAFADSTTKAVEMLKSDRISVFLDGLDEIAENLRPVALEALSKAAFRLVITSRIDEMAVASTQNLLEGAAAIELQQVDSDAAAEFLERVQRDPSPRGWEELTWRLRAAPRSPIAQALSSPLTLTLVRDTYRRDDDVRELLAYSDSLDSQHPEIEITDYLLDRILPAAYAPQPGEAHPRYDLETAQRTLQLIAAVMNKMRTRDLGWWIIRYWTPLYAYACVSALVGAVSGVVIGGLGFGLKGAAIGGAAIGIIAGLRAASPTVVFSLSPPEVRILRWRSLRSPMLLIAGFQYGLARWLMLWVFAGLVRGWYSTFEISLFYGFASGVLLWLADGGSPDRFMDGTSQPRPGNEDAFTPVALWRGERALSFLWGLRFALLGAVIVYVGVGFRDGVWREVVAAAVAAIAGTFLAKTMWQVSVSFAELHMRWRTPLKFMRFLEDARGRGVLRTVGPVYQFRHSRLQDRLAVRSKPDIVPLRGHGSRIAVHDYFK